MPWIKPGSTIDCVECSKTIEKHSATQRYCQECSLAKARALKRNNTTKKRNVTLGRVCGECSASDEDKTWAGRIQINGSLVEVCAACARAIERGRALQKKGQGNGMLCGRCGHIGGSFGCVYCTKPTPGRIDVTFYSKKTEQTRVIRKPIRGVTKDGVGTIVLGPQHNQTLIKVSLDDPAVWIEHDKFISIRR